MLTTNGHESTRIHEIENRRSEVRRRTSGERTRLRVLAMAPSPSLTFPSWALRRGRRNEHALRVRYPETPRQNELALQFSPTTRMQITTKVCDGATPSPDMRDACATQNQIARPRQPPTSDVRPLISDLSRFRTCLNQRAFLAFKRTVNHESTRIHKTIRSHSSLRRLKLRISPTCSCVIRR